jgi:hypothetical protein
MNLLAKLALTVVMLAIGAAPALTLHSDTFLSGANPPNPGKAPASPIPPATEPSHDEAPPATEGLVPGIPKTEAEWNAWIAHRTGQEESAVDPAPDVESPIGDSEVDPVHDGSDVEPVGHVPVEDEDPDNEDESQGDEDEEDGEEEEDERGLLGILG